MPPSVNDEVENHCPYGCSREELDELGMCQHVVGFCTLDRTKPEKPARDEDRQIVEPLEAATRRRRDPETGEVVEVETGFLRVNGAAREYLQEGDKLVNPSADYVDSQTGQKIEHWKWFSWRVYHKNPEKRVPKLVPQPKKVVKARPKRQPESVAS